jgi:hypothetical protein
MATLDPAGLAIPDQAGACLADRTAGGMPAPVVVCILDPVVAFILDPAAVCIPGRAAACIQDRAAACIPVLEEESTRGLRVTMAIGARGAPALRASLASNGRRNTARSSERPSPSGDSHSISRKRRDRLRAGPLLSRNRSPPERVGAQPVDCPLRAATVAAFTSTRTGVGGTDEIGSPRPLIHMKFFYDSLLTVPVILGLRFQKRFQFRTEESSACFGFVWTSVEEKCLLDDPGIKGLLGPDV